MAALKGLAGTSEPDGRTRFARWGAWPARLVLVLFAALSLYGLAITLTREPPKVRVASEFALSDAALYKTIAERVGAGEDYYVAAISEQRARLYPLRPFVTVRMPTLAWIMGALGDGAVWLYRAIALAAVLVLAHRFSAATLPRGERMTALGIAAFAVALLTDGGAPLMHEQWAGMLVTLSLACRSRKHWTASVLLGLAAACIRELALPYLCVMAFFAWREKAWREMLGWMIAIGFVAAALAVHAITVVGLVTVSDRASPGWADAGGWSFILMLAQRSTALTMLPVAAAALLVPLSLLGWAAWNSATGARVLLLLAGYFATFMIIGRMENFYWGLLISPLLLSGLAFALRGLRDLSLAAGWSPLRWKHPRAVGA